MSEAESKVEEKPAQEGESKPAENGDTAEKVAEMRAVVLTGFGGLKTVKVLKKPEPTLAEGEVLIRVKAWWVDFTAEIKQKLNFEGILELP